MVTLNSADNALKSVYLDVVSNLLNTKVNPLMSMIKKTESDVWGKEIIKLAPFGVNGGIGAGDESGVLPKSGENNYVRFITTLKNLYGNIEISDKAMKASANNAGAFVNLLNAEMEGLLNSSIFNFGRMLYGDGTGKLATVASVAEPDGVVVDSIKNLIEGQVLDVYTSAGAIRETAVKARIVAIDRVKKVVKFNKPVSTLGITAKDYFTIQNSKDKELTGLGAIFKTTGKLYGLDKAEHNFLNPMITETATLTDAVMQEAVDNLDQYYGSEVDFIVCSHKVKRIYQEYLQTTSRHVNTMELNGGYKAISFNGIPLIADRFVEDDAMYLLNTNDFALHQICDWQWLEDDGKVIRQKPGYPTYEATLVKYADLICSKPNGQAKIVVKGK